MEGAMCSFQDCKSILSQTTKVASIRAVMCDCPCPREGAQHNAKELGRDSGWPVASPSVPQPSWLTCRVPPDAQLCPGLGELSSPSQPNI